MNYYQNTLHCHQPIQNHFNPSLINQHQQNINFPLFNVETGYALGNLFEGLYSPYKSFTNYPLTPTNEKEKLHQQMLMYKFAAHELNLYLDVYPNDQKMIQLFNQYNQTCQQLTNRYTSMYGPITTDNINPQSNQWTWSNSPWPWENQ